MSKRLLASGFWSNAMLRVAVLSLLAPAPLLAAKKNQPPPELPRIRATQQPAYSIPVEPLGFTPPGDFYLGMRNALASLDFLDEDHLLFTFRVPGLIRRDHQSAEEGKSERRIRAVVLHLPDGAVEAETLWTVHDRRRYLWMLDHGEYLVRDGNDLLIGDSSLQLKPYLRFPGPVISVELDPSHKYFVTNSDEPPARKPAAGTLPSPSTSSADIQAEGDQAAEESAPDTVVRIIRRSDGRVMLVSHVRNAIHLPINDNGYIETLRGQGSKWVVNLAHFTGGSTPMGTVESVCSPVVNFLSPDNLLVTTCNSGGDPRLVAMSTQGRRLWEDSPSAPAIWPLLVMAPNGLRLARETLLTTHGVGSSAPLGTDDIKGQDVAVMDTASGKIVLRAAATPVLDAGGNVAISPSAQRVAIIMDRAIQVFELPSPPSVADSHLKQANR